MFTGIVEETGTVRSLVRPDGDAADAVLTVTAPLAASDARLGDSVAVNGVCLTVTGISGGDALLRDSAHDRPTTPGDDHHGSAHGLAATPGGTADPTTPHTLTFDVMPESLRRTALGDLVPGARVNIERALPVSGRLGGHVVQGHVDGTATLASRTPGPRWDDLVFTAGPALLRYVAEKGSIALHGVSLTVTSVSDGVAPGGALPEGAPSDGTGPDDGPGVPGTFGVSLIPTTLEATNLGELTPGSTVNVEVDVLAKYAERLLTGVGTAPAPDPAASAPQQGVPA